MHDKPRKSSERFGAIPKWVLTHPLSGLEMRVLAMIAVYDGMSSRGDNGEKQVGCIKSARQLAKDLGASRVHVQRAIVRLVEIGVVERINRLHDKSYRMKVVYEGGTNVDAMGGIQTDAGWHPNGCHGGTVAGATRLEPLLEPVTLKPKTRPLSEREREEIPFFD